MTDEYWKKRAAELNHYEPAHKTQGKNLDDYLNGVPGLPKSPGTPMPNNGEVDVTSRLMARLAQQQHQQPPAPTNQQAPQQQVKVVYLREGTQAYRRLEVEPYGYTTPLARSVGPAAGVTGRQFEFKGIVNALIVEGMRPVDMSSVDYSKMKKLAVISAPFIGTLLVPENAIFRVENSSGGRSLLKG